MRFTPHCPRRWMRKSAVVWAMSSLRKGDGGEQRVRVLPRVQSGVLHDDGNVALEYARVVGTVRDRLRIVEVVESKMLGAARRHGHAVRTGRLAIAEVDGDDDVGVGVVRVEDARRLVAEKLRLTSVAPFGDVPLGDGPARPSDHFRTSLEKR